MKETAGQQSQDYDNHAQDMVIKQQHILFAWNVCAAITAIMCL